VETIALEKEVTMSQAEVIETTVGEVAAELASRGLDPDDRVTITIEPKASQPGQPTSPARVSAPAENEMDPLIKQAHEDVETVDLMEMYRDIV
jgi:hypothetical protein